MEATASPSRAAANMRNIMLHEAKPYPRALPHTSVTRGFEAAAFPKIVRELQDSSLVVRQKALLAARELLGSPMGYMQCIAAGITSVVVNLLTDSDALVRERAAGTLEYIAVKEVGARDIIQHSGVPKLVMCLQDEVLPVRDAAYRALIEAGRFDAVRRELITLDNPLQLLMGLVSQEDHLRSLYGLQLLNACVQARHNDAALEQLIDKASGIHACVELLSAERRDDVQEQAAQLLGLLTSRFSDAKEKAVRSGAVPRLLELLRKGSVPLALAATTALMTIAVANEGKYAVINTEAGLEAIAILLDPAQEQLCVNLMEVISNVAEAPEARPVLDQCGARQRLMHIFEKAKEDSLLKRSAAQALRQCKFIHWPYEPLPGKTVSAE